MIDGFFFIFIDATILRGKEFLPKDIVDCLTPQITTNLLLLKVILRLNGPLK